MTTYEKAYQGYARSDTDTVWINRCYHVAQRSSIRGYQTGAIIVPRAGSPNITYGWSHRSQIRYNQTPFSCHAELHAISRAPRASLPGATIYVVTILRKSSNIVSGEPCIICKGVLEKVGIERAVHT